MRDAYFDRFDICEAYLVAEWYWNEGGWLQERPSNKRRMESTDVQLHRMQFRARPNLDYSTLTSNGKEIFLLLVSRLKLATTKCRNPLCDCFAPTLPGEECTDCGGVHVMLKDATVPEDN